MQTITEFDKHTALSFKAAVESKLREIEDEFGVSMSIAKIAVSSKRTINMTLQSSIGSEVRLQDTPSGRQFLHMCQYHSIDPKALGGTIKMRGTLYTVTGWNGARKYSVDIERVSDGKGFRTTPREVAQTYGV